MQLLPVTADFCKQQRDSAWVPPGSKLRLRHDPVPYTEIFFILHVKQSPAATYLFIHTGLNSLSTTPLTHDLEKDFVIMAPCKVSALRQKKLSTFIPCFQKRPGMVSQDLSSRLLCSKAPTSASLQNRVTPSGHRLV